MRITIDITAEEVREVMDLDSMTVLPDDIREKVIDCIREIDEHLNSFDSFMDRE